MVQKSVKVPCEDGTLTVVVQAEAGRLVDEVLLLIRALDHYPDRTMAGMWYRIKRNVEAQADWDSVYVGYRMDGPADTSNAPTS